MALIGYWGCFGFEYIELLLHSIYPKVSITKKKRESTFQQILSIFALSYTITDAE